MRSTTRGSVQYKRHVYLDWCEVREVSTIRVCGGPFGITLAWHPGQNWHEGCPRYFLHNSPYNIFFTLLLKTACGSSNEKLNWSRYFSYSWPVDILKYTTNPATPRQSWVCYGVDDSKFSIKIQRNLTENLTQNILRTELNLKIWGYVEFKKKVPAGLIN